MHYRIKMAVALGVTVLLNAEASHSTRVQRLSLTEIRDQAVSIVVAKVSAKDFRLGPEAKMVWTDYELEVEDVLIGGTEPTQRTLSFAGGEAEGREVGIIGVPRLEVGKRYVFFLYPEGTPWPAPTIGWGQGIFEIVPERSTLEPEVLVSYDGEPLEIGPQGLRRGSFVVRSDQWIALPQQPNVHRGSREAEPLVLNEDGKEIEQPPQALELQIPLDKRNFASLSHLRRFVMHDLAEDIQAQD